MIKAAQTSCSEQQPHQSGTTDLRVNAFFDHLRDLYGSKYKHAFTDENGERMAKITYKSAIEAINDQTLVEGLKRLRSARMKGLYLWLEMAEVIGFIQGSIGDVEQLKRGYKEFMDGGIPILKKMEVPTTGALVQETIGRTWSSGLLFECSKRLGSPKFLTSPESDFNAVYLAVLQDERMGKMFLLPKQIAHQAGSNKHRTKDDIERIKNSEGFKDFFAQHGGGAGK
jgi:hypothetical protein